MSSPLIIVADAHIWGVESAFSAFPGFKVDLRIVESRDITSETVQGADILLTRSSTRVNADLLQGSKVRFAATATIGDDHYDKAYLESRGIPFANAAGSSTKSVIEYMIATLFELHSGGLIHIPKTCIGIIGAGRIGSGLEKICRDLGMDILVNDPPRARLEGREGFADLDELLEQADILSLHTPLTHIGSDPSFHLIDADRLERFRGRGLINAGRGACVDNNALLNWLDSDQKHFAALDCWENEPNISRRLLTHPGMVLATPHIAGHSLDGKAANTQFAHNALCSYLGINKEWDMREQLPLVDTDPVQIKAGGDIWSQLRLAIIRLYNIREDDLLLKTSSRYVDDEMAKSFTKMRQNYPIRRSWNKHPVHFTKLSPELGKMSAGLGLNVV